MTTHICTVCEDEVDEADWDDDDEMCPACFEVSGGLSYCCGIMYDDGEVTCRSCGDPL